MKAMIPTIPSQFSRARAGLSPVLEMLNVAIWALFVLHFLLRVVHATRANRGERLIRVVSCDDAQHHECRLLSADTRRMVAGPPARNEVVALNRRVENLLKRLAVTERPLLADEGNLPAIVCSRWCLRGRDGLRRGAPSSVPYVGSVRRVRPWRVPVTARHVRTSPQAPSRSQCPRLVSCPTTRRVRRS